MVSRLMHAGKQRAAAVRKFASQTDTIRERMERLNTTAAVRESDVVALSPRGRGRKRGALRWARMPRFSVLRFAFLRFGALAFRRFGVLRVSILAFQRLGASVWRSAFCVSACQHAVRQYSILSVAFAFRVPV